MTSIIGHTTALRFLAISASKGSNQPSVHSQWASEKWKIEELKRAKKVKKKSEFYISGNFCR
jgi:hypothetical protein